MEKTDIEKIEESKIKTIELQMKADKLRHEMKMLEIKAEIEKNEHFHQKELERIRIKSAEIRRSQERRNF